MTNANALAITSKTSVGTAPTNSVPNAKQKVNLKVITENPSITQKQLSEKIGKSERTVKTRTIEMQKKGLIRRLNGKRNGRWEILANVK